MSAISEPTQSEMRQRREEWERLNPFEQPEKWSEEAVALGEYQASSDRRWLRRSLPGRLLVRGFRTLGKTLSLMNSERSDSAPHRLQQPWLPPWKGLPSKPFPDPKQFSWTRELEAEYPAIRKELCDYLEKEKESFPRAHFDGFGGTPWTALYFDWMGKRNKKTHRLFPRTSAALAKVPDNRFHTCFSCVESGAVLPPHVGPTNTSLICHLGVLESDSTALFAGNETRRYRDGKCLLLDDSFVHAVKNTGDHPRYTLMFAFWHPHTSAAERAVLGPVYRAVSRLG